MSFSFNSNNPRTLSLHIIDEGMVGEVLKSNLLVGRGAQTLIQACLKCPDSETLTCAFILL